jgi:hypothetical protein
MGIVIMKNGRIIVIPLVEVLVSNGKNKGMPSSG